MPIFGHALGISRIHVISHPKFKLFENLGQRTIGPSLDPIEIRHSLRFTIHATASSSSPTLQKSRSTPAALARLAGLVLRLA
jgi:hypothetical protein